jgi:ERCC4-type nuclease
VTIRIVVDSREPRGGVPHWLTRLDVETETRRLAAGDYVVGPGALVERKTVRGLHAAIVSGTFWPQVGSLRASARFCYVLIEGRDLDDGPLTAASIRGACIALFDLGVDLLRSESPRDSALWLQRIAERRTTVRYRDRAPYAQRPKRNAGLPAAEAALACVPGISTHHARALLSRFGSLAEIARETPAEWQRVSGIGPARATALATTLHASPTSSGSRLRREPRDRAT